MAQTKGKTRRMINGQFPAVPFWLRSVALIGFCLSLLLFFAVLRSRGQHSPEPRIHLVQDMDNQAKYKTQHASEVFADGRASRPHVIGTIARGQLQADDHLYRGYSVKFDAAKGTYNTTFFDGIPIPVNDDLLLRGQRQFNTYCLPCHGADGHGNGPVNYDVANLRLRQSDQVTWVQPSNLTAPATVARKDGEIYAILVNGVRNMAPYGPAIQDVNDRWAIVAYVRALQLASSQSSQQPQPQASAK